MRSRRQLLAGCLAVAAMTAPAALAVAGGPDGKGPKNPNACVGGAKIEPVVDGTYLRTLNGAPLVINLDVNESAQRFAFGTDSYVTSVAVKGGPGPHEVTEYPAPGTMGDTGLHAPLNPRSGKYYGLSHVCFFGEEAGTLVEPPVEEPPVEEPEPVEEPPADDPPLEELLSF
jgi:hypothetical protein